MNRKIAGELTRLNAIAPVEMTPHDSTRCAVCAYEGGDHAYWCEAHLRSKPSEAVGAVERDTLRLLAILPKQFGHYGDRLNATEGALLDHAAQCVRDVAALRAEVERLRSAPRVTEDEKLAFVQGAKWWEFKQTNATMWPSDQDEAYAMAEQKILAARRTAALGGRDAE